jgi:hypothetical protein
LTTRRCGARTKATLAASKARGTRIGSNRRVKLTVNMRNQPA